MLITYPSHRLAYLSLAALPICAVLAYNVAVFGAPLETGYGESARSDWTETWWHGFAGLLVSPAAGLLVFSPFLVVPIIESVRVLRYPRTLPFACSLAFWTFAAMMGSWWGWAGGWSYGNRMLTDVVPLLAVLSLRPWQARRPLVDGVLLVTATLAIGFHAVGLLDYGWNWHQAHRDAGYDQAWLWDPGRSPIVFYAARYGDLLMGRLGNGLE